MHPCEQLLLSLALCLNIYFFFPSITNHLINIFDNVDTKILESLIKNINNDKRLILAKQNPYLNYTKKWHGVFLEDIDILLINMRLNGINNEEVFTIINHIAFNHDTLYEATIINLQGSNEIDENFILINQTIYMEIKTAKYECKDRMKNSHELFAGTFIHRKERITKLYTEHIIEIIYTSKSQKICLKFLFDNN